MTTIQQISLDKIKPGKNDRTLFKATVLAELAASIKQDGLIQPITVRPIGETGQFEIVAGERRFRAVKTIDWATIPAIVKPLDDKTCSRIMLAENLQRAGLDAIDEASAYQSRIDEFGLSVAEVAVWANISPARVRGRLGLLKLIPDVQHLVKHGNMPLGFAGAMVGLDKNYQLIAFRYFGQAKRPTVTEFRALCSGLREKQDQISMFDTAEFMTRPIEAIADVVKEIPPTALQFTLFGYTITIERPAAHKVVLA